MLWHPSEHEPLSWAVPVRPGTLVGAVHLAPQTWSDGTFRNLYIRFDDPATLAPEIQERIVYEHCVVAAGLGFGPESLGVEEPMGYRVHQWQATNAGVVGRSSAIGVTRPETLEEGLVWAKHCAEEIGNWGVPPTALRPVPGRRPTRAQPVHRPERRPRGRYRALPVRHVSGETAPRLGGRSGRDRVCRPRSAAAGVHPGGARRDALDGGRPRRRRADRSGRESGAGHAAGRHTLRRGRGVGAVHDRRAHSRTASRSTGTATS